MTVFAWGAGLGVNRNRVACLCGALRNFVELFGRCVCGIFMLGGKYKTQAQAAKPSKNVSPSCAGTEVPSGPFQNVAQYGPSDIVTPDACVDEDHIRLVILR